MFNIEINVGKFCLYLHDPVKIPVNVYGICFRIGKCEHMPGIYKPLRAHSPVSY